MHYLMMISKNSIMTRGLELLIKSIIFFSRNKNFYFSVVIQGDSLEFPSNLDNIIQEIKKDDLKLLNYGISNYVLKIVDEFYFCSQYWRLGMPNRWLIKPKSDMCIMIDVDMLACNDLNDVYNLNRNKIHGVRARNTFIENDFWNKINFSKEDILKYYINFGFVAVPSIYLKVIGEELFYSYKKMTKVHEYYAGQLALAFTFKKLKFSPNILSKKFNFYDLDQFPGRDNILFLHILGNKKIYEQKIVNNKNNDYENLIISVNKEIKTATIL